MRTRWLVVGLTVSVLLNLYLLLGWLRTHQPQAPVTRLTTRRPVVITNLLRPLRTNIVFAPRLLSWRDIESEDYPTYIANLRAIGCPEATVQDIIVADVNELFAARRLAEVPNPRREWWRSEPDPELVRQAEARRAALDAERRALLATLLGPDWETRRLTALAEESRNPLDGEILGALSAETRRQVREIEQRHARRLEALRAAAAPETADPEADLARLERETRAELARVLTPAQLEEYLLRYSTTADRLRAQLRGFNATPEEFRALFRARAQMAERLDQLESGPGSPADARQLAALAREYESTLEKTLGPARYAHYRLLQDPLFRQTRQTAERLGVEPEKLIPLYRVNQLAAEERQRVLADTTLSEEARTRELAELYTAHLASLRQLLGEDAFRRWQAEGPP